MKLVNLIRFCYAPIGTFGYAQTETGVIYTVERPWMSNIKNTSCIPEGEYACEKTFFHKDNYDAIGIKNVPNRDNVLIHIANYPTDVLGCIGVGSGIGSIKGRWAVLNSEATFKAFMAVYSKEPFKLVISQVKGATLET